MAASIQSTYTSTDFIMSSLRTREESSESASPLMQVFHKLGYTTEEQQLGLIKLLAITKTFPVTTSDETLLTDEEARQYLYKLEFPSEKEAFQWLLKATQSNWLRNSSNEGIDQSREANLARWFTSDTEKVTKTKEMLLNIIDKLGFLAGSHWTQAENPPTIFLNSGLESHIIDRLEALKQLPEPKEGDKIPLCYLTGPRGVFKFEPSLPKILAHWFKNESLIPEFTAVLKNYPKDWGNGCALQQQLLILSVARPDVCHKPEIEKLVAELDAGGDKMIAKKLVEDYWPKEEGYYTRTPEKYDSETAYWPVAADIVDHHLNLLKHEYPGKYDRLELVPIVARGKGGRLANTQDTIEQWILEKGNDLLALHQNVVVASLSSQPHVIYMDQTAHLCLPKGIDVITISVDGNKEKMQMATILDVFARYIYTMRPIMEM